MEIRILNYLDDWLILAQLQVVLTLHRTLLLSHLDCLGLRVNFAKSILSPSQRVSFLGTVIDSVQLYDSYCLSGASHHNSASRGFLHVRHRPSAQNFEKKKLEVTLHACERPSCVGPEQSALAEGDACAGQNEPRSKHFVEESLQRNGRFTASQFRKFGKSLATLE